VVNDEVVELIICYNILMFLQKKNLKRGFTLVELLVVISIFAILTGVVLFNQTKFNSTILLTNLAYDTALTIRQAQTYGINIKEFNTSTGGRFIPYGVHFDRVNEPKSFILFADLTYDEDNEKSDGLYPSGTGVSLSKCQVDKGCVSRYSIKRGNSIGDLCVNTGATETCKIRSLDIVFQRPNPDARIQAVNESGNIITAEIVKAKIKLIGVDGSERIVIVQANGLIQIGN